jgi:sulfhydrogenase subunit beta (sulfur reductase)
MPDIGIIDQDGLQALLDALRGRGFDLIGPTQERGAIVYAPIHTLGDMPIGYEDEQAGGHYRLRKRPPEDPLSNALFGYAVGPHSWKRYLFPPRQKLWSATREGNSFALHADAEAPPRYAFIAVRPCELAAIKIQDRVFNNGLFADTAYNARRQSAFVVAVNCNRPAATCFCASMGSGPSAADGYDVCLSELLDAKASRFLIRAGSAAGRELLAELAPPPASQQDLDLCARLADQASAALVRSMPAPAAQILRENPEHPRWELLAQRCLGCANCTLVCPTCFCSTLEDTTSLDGADAARWRRWDSCFTLDFSYIHGGSIRREAASRYRQWLSHKLAYWHEQFGSSGCCGCGRCITWCPVAIDITEEVTALSAAAAVSRQED